MSDYLFSPSRVAFYAVSMREDYVTSGSWPDDGVLVSEAVHTRIMDEQSAGRIVCASAEGQPMTKAPPPPTAEELAAFERSWRDNQLGETDALVARHRDELEIGPTTLSGDQYQELQAYRRALRDWPGAERFPQSDNRPLQPEWLLGALSKR